MKVRPFPGASVDDMLQYLKPLLKKFPDTIIVYVGTNDCAKESSVLDKVLNLQTFMQNFLPHCKMITPNVIDRTDDGEKIK